MWTRDKQLDVSWFWLFLIFVKILFSLKETALKGTLQPIIQAAHLLQARKSDEDVVSVCEMCNALTPLQICKILNLYSPIDEFEQRVPISFINKVQAKLQERPNYSEQQVSSIQVVFSCCNFMFCRRSSWTSSIATQFVFHLFLHVFVWRTSKFLIY